MRYLNNIQIIIVLTVLIISSCAKPIDFKVSEDEKKIVLNGIIQPDSLIKINLSKSIGVLETEGTVEFITTGEVKLFEDDNYIEDLTHSGNGYYVSSVYPQKGREYMVSANYNKLEEAIGKTILPEPIEISNFEYSYDTITITEERYNEITQQYYDTSFVEIINTNAAISFNDPLNEENYYFLTFTALKETYEHLPPDYYPVYLGKQMQSVSYNMGHDVSWENRLNINNEDGYVISDELFNGNTHRIHVNEFYLYDIAEPKIYVNLYTIKKELFNFAISLSKYAEAWGNPLAEPVNVLSNIEGGYGFFSGYSLSQDSIVFNIE